MRPLKTSPSRLIRSAARTPRALTSAASRAPRYLRLVLGVQALRLVLRFWEYRREGRDGERRIGIRPIRPMVEVVLPGRVLLTMSSNALRAAQSCSETQKLVNGLWVPSRSSGEFSARAHARDRGCDCRGADHGCAHRRSPPAARHGRGPRRHPPLADSARLGVPAPRHHDAVHVVLIRRPAVAAGATTLGES